MQPVSSLIPRLERASQTAYGLVALLGALAIWGWALDIAVLRDLGADFAPMPPAAALAFVLLATSFLPAKGEKARTARAPAVLAGTLAAWRLIETLAGFRAAMTFDWLAPSG